MLFLIENEVLKEVFQVRQLSQSEAVFIILYIN